MNSLFCLVVLAFASVIAYKQDGNNCNMYEALSCEPKARDGCIDIENKKMGMPESHIDLSKICIDRLPKSTDAWFIPFIKCYMTDGGFIKGTSVNYDHLHEKLGLYTKVDNTTTKCFEELFPLGEVGKIADCFFKAAMTRCE